MSYKETIEKLCQAALNPGKTIKETKETTGKKIVGVFPIHTPEEIVYAAGCVPIGMWGGKTEIQLADKYLQSFCCSIMRANMENAMKGVYNDVEAVIIPCFCDTLKCIVEDWKVAMPEKATICLTYPQNRKIGAGLDFFISELKRVRKELEKALKIIIPDSKIEEAFELYEAYRKSMREFMEEATKHPDVITAKKRVLIVKAGEYMDKAVYKGMIDEITAGLKAEKPSEFNGTKVVVTGLMAEPIEVLDIFEENNIAIVGDDLSLGSRKFRTPGRDTDCDVYTKMAYRVQDQEGDTFLYEPEKKKGQMIIDMVKDKKADGVVVFMMKFCDPEEYDYPILKEELANANVPELYLEIDLQLATFEQLRTRIQSFSELLS